MESRLKLFLLFECLRASKIIYREKLEFGKKYVGLGVNGEPVYIATAISHGRAIDWQSVLICDMSPALAAASGL